MFTFTDKKILLSIKITCSFDINQNLIFLCEISQPHKYIHINQENLEDFRFDICFYYKN